MQTTKTKQVPPSRAIRIPKVCDLTGASRATVWRWVTRDHSFPKPFHLSSAITCWDEGEILDWIEAKKAARGAR
jgi:predicted DNA-binding transcriptional regulator AlpA